MLFEQIPYEQTQAINQWRNVGKSPFSDECLVYLTTEERYDDSGELVVDEETRGVYLDCTYEEDITTASAQTRWEIWLPVSIFHQVVKMPWPEIPADRLLLFRARRPLSNVYGRESRNKCWTEIDAQCQR